MNLEIKIITPPSIFPAFPQLGSAIIYRNVKQKYKNTKHLDLNLLSWEVKLSKSYISNLKLDKSISEVNRGWFNENFEFCKNEINDCIIRIRCKKMDTEEYIKTSIIIRKCLRLISIATNINWTVSGIDYLKEIKNYKDVLDIVENTDFDFFLKDYKNKFREKTSGKKRIYCFSISYSSQLIPTLKLIRFIKMNDQKSIIIVGGSYSTYFQDELEKILLNREWIDFIIVYNGEITLLSLIQRITELGSFNDIFNLIYKEPNTKRIIKNSFNPHISSTSTLIPLFDKKLLKRYFSPEIILPIIISQGCYYGKCSFCSHHYNYGSFNGFMSTELMGDILSEYTLKYNVKAIYFVDEALPPNVLENLSDIIINSKIKIEWLLETRAETGFSDSKLIEKLARSGCSLISFGIESTNSRILKKMNKNLNINDFRNIIAILKEFKIQTAATFIIDFPSETKNELLETLNEIKINENLDFFGISRFALMKYSPIYENPENFNIKVCELKDYMTLQFDYQPNENKAIEAYNEFIGDSFILKRILTSDCFLNRVHHIFYKYETNGKKA